MNERTGVRRVGAILHGSGLAIALVRGSMDSDEANGGETWVGGLSG